MPLLEQPRKGQRVAWRNQDGKLYGRATVLRIEGNLCWIKPDDGGDSAPFIWWFPRDNCFNQLAEIVPEDVTHTLLDRAIGAIGL